MKRYLIILFFFIPFIAFGQQPEYPDSGFTNKAEAKNLMVNGKKEGKWVEYYKETEIGHGEHIGWYIKITKNRNAPLYMLTIYKADTAYGIVRLYENGSGKLITETKYINGVALATKAYDENGNEIKQ